MTGAVLVISGGLFVLAVQATTQWLFPPADSFSFSMERPEAGDEEDDDDDDSDDSVEISP